MDPEIRTDFGTTKRIDAIGGSSNPLIIHDSKIEYVDAHFSPDLFVVYDSSCTMINYNQDFGDNVTIAYDSCNVARANRVLAFFELIDGTRWEF